MLRRPALNGEEWCARSFRREDYFVRGSGSLISLGPAFTVLLSVIFLKEKVRVKLGLALVLAVVGAAILSIPDLAEGFASLSGPLAAVLSAFLVAAFSVLSKPLVARYGALRIAVWWAGMLGTCMLLPLFSSTFVTGVTALSL